MPVVIFFVGEQVARDIGWEPGSPFQEEIGFASLAFGILGIMCIWFRDGFWLATGLGYSILMLGAAAVHLKDLRKRDNRSKYNAGFALLVVHDILVPLFVLGLLFLKFNSR